MIGSPGEKMLGSQATYSAPSPFLLGPCDFRIQNKEAS